MVNKMFNNSHASHLHVFATLEVLFLHFMMNNKDSIAGTVWSEVTLPSYMLK